MSNENIFGEEWETEESSDFKLPIHPAHYRVKTATFATDSNYQAGSVYRLNLIGDVHDPSTGKLLRANHEKLWIGLGGKAGDWFSPDGGKTIEHKEGKARFNKISTMGKIIDVLAEKGKAGDEKVRAFAARGSLKRAATWEGVTLVVDEVGITINEKQADGTRAEKTTKVESVVGVVDVGSGSGSPAAGNGTSDEFEAKAKELAAAAGSFEEFKDNAMAAGLASGDVNRFKTRILAESGVWAEVRGG